MSAAPQYAEVAVTLPVAGLFHYRVPAHLAARARVGARVLVRFGPRKVTGVVVREGGVPPEGVSPVDLSEVLDEEPALSRELVDLCLWIAEYYEAPPGEVMRAALPAGSGVVARGVIAMTEAGRAAYEGQGAALAPKQRALLGRLAAEDLPEGGLRPAERAAVEALVAQRLVERREQRGKARARLRRERVARLAVDAGAARDQVARAPKRWAVVEALAGVGADWLTVAALEQQVPGAKVALRELVKAGLVEVTERELPIEAASVNADPQAARPPVLTAEQAVAVAEIVGQKLRALGSARQALCVTHLPQVAAQGHAHYRVSKASSDGVTQSAVHSLTAKEREEELARMLGGVEVSREARAAAKRLLADVN